NVDGRFLVSYETGDDHFDMSEGYSGRLQYLIAYQDTVLTPRANAGSPSSDPQGIENDGCNGSGCTLGHNSTPFTLPIVANFTIVGTGKTALSASGGGIGLMLRRGTGGHYVNGIVARYPRAGVALRDSSTFARANSAATPDLATSDLAIRNVLFVDNANLFETGSGRFAFDAASNTLVTSAATTASVFTAFPADATASTSVSAFDWTPSAGSAALSGGLAAFTGRLQTRAGTVVTGTSFVGAAPPVGSPNARWWAGWTTYAQQ
ncbi:MAG: hypothetical protein H0X64_09425, partial [Gemmatimonadaceae bacterium]|nr:hypothetical protein [Gemmatimonadaceae bacterium]